MSDSVFTPFILGHADNLAYLPDQLGDQKIIKIPMDSATIHIESTSVKGVSTSLSPSRFSRLLNLANGLAYGGGMGMPEWVMLDCALLPAFFAGFMGPAHYLTTGQFTFINEQLNGVEAERSKRRVFVERSLGVTQGDLDPHEWFPLAEFCAIPRLAPQEIVGYSLYSLRRGLGVRSKAFGLWLLQHLGYQRQVGVAQWTNPSAVRAHLRFGPLELIDPLTPSHTKAGETFIYRLRLPPSEELLRRALGEIKSDKDEEGAHKSNDDLALKDSEWLSIEDTEWMLAQRDVHSRPYLLELRGKGDGLEALIAKTLAPSENVSS